MDQHEERQIKLQRLYGIMDDKALANLDLIQAERIMDADHGSRAVIGQVHRLQAGLDGLQIVGQRHGDLDSAGQRRGKRIGIGLDKIKLFYRAAR